MKSLNIFTTKAPILPGWGQGSCHCRKLVPVFIFIQFHLTANTDIFNSAPVSDDPIIPRTQLKSNSEGLTCAPPFARRALLIPWTRHKLLFTVKHIPREGKTTLLKQFSCTNSLPIRCARSETAVLQAIFMSHLSCRRLEAGRLTVQRRQAQWLPVLPLSTFR